MVGWSGKANLEIGGTLNMTDKWIIVNNVSLTSDGAIITGNQRTDGTVPTIRVRGDVTAEGNASYGAYTTGKMLNLRFNSSGSYGSDGDHTISVANGKTLNVYGAIQKEGTGTLILRKKGTGELVLDKTDTSAALLSGTTYIDEGKVTLKGASSKKLTTSNVVASGAVLNMADGGQLDGSALAIAGTFQFSGGTTHTTITLDGDGAKIIGSSSSILFKTFPSRRTLPSQGRRSCRLWRFRISTFAEGKTLNLSGFQTRNTTNALHLTGKRNGKSYRCVLLTAGSTIYVDEGTLKMGGHHLLSNVSLNISSKFELGKFWNSNTQNLTFSADGALIQGTWRSASEGEASYGVLRVNGDVTANADSSITDTTLLFYQKGKGALDANGNHNITVAANKTLTINQNLGQNDNSSNEVSLTKLGDGTLQLANLNTRSEAATFAAREFMGGFSINDGTVLASGKFSGAVTLADGAVLSPGTLTNGTMADTAGTLQLASLENNGTLEMDVLNAQTFDVLNVIGTFETSNGNILLNLADDYMPETSDTLRFSPDLCPKQQRSFWTQALGLIMRTISRQARSLSETWPPRRNLQVGFCCWSDWAS